MMVKGIPGHMGLAPSTAAEKPMLIGIDFDNTVAGYDRLFADLALEYGFLPTRLSGKPAVRDALRAKGEAGEREWQYLQALAYGRRMGEAELITGVEEFLGRCRNAEVPVCIVSHKTRRSPVDERGVDLCGAALAWMEARGFFGPEGLGLARDRVYFEPTRQAKLARISALGCTHFVDDLPEVFGEPGFPDKVEAILFDPSLCSPDKGRWKRFGDWQGIREHVFAGDAAA